MNKEALVKRLNASARRQKADIVIKNGKIMDVYNHQWIYEDIAITDGVIVGLGLYEGEETIDAEGQVIVPGFIDGHVHIESSMVTPIEFAKAVLPNGVTTIITDPHEIANVSGQEGIKFMIEQARQTPLNIHFMLPSSVPAASFERSGAVLQAADLKPFYEEKEVLGLAEVMDYVSVEQGEADMVNKLFDARSAGKRIDGHLAGLSTDLINIYRTAFVLTDHEVTTKEEALDRIRRGMYVMMREGSVAKNTMKVLPAVNEKNARRFFFCTDDKHVDDLLSEGSVNHQVKMAIQAGLDPFLAYQLGSLNAAECYGLDTKGAVAPGFDADLLFISDVENVTVTKTLVKGQTVAEDNKAVCQAQAHTLTPDLTLLHSVNLAAPLSEQDFHMPIDPQQQMNVIQIIPNQLETRLVSVPAPEAPIFQPDIDLDLLKIAVVERHKGLKETGLGIVKGFGLKSGAIATTISHDSHNIIAVGTNDTDIAAAVNKLQEIGGGLTVIKDGEELHSVPLPIAGLLSDQSAELVNQSLMTLHEKLSFIGFKDRFNPFLTLSFLALPVIPDIKMTTTGLFDVKSFQHIALQ
ncbi:MULTISPECIES: adenine deaminase [Bacillus]|uniref:adenine deaminase n=1 Tax=Bacillus TaxID=1386 RepID=UPI000D038906|nr:MULTISPECIES: adenine deaminase [Bacillus]MBV7319911.1 adenine deaminase [Halalkalibacterium halodurans]MCV0025158.1 adenine deaminase [Bacillus sp. XT-2]PRS04085.1 adenine deaminase [Bacillus halotolerans]PRS20255.1 adenine deaminase [Bacillus halotolerans]QDK68833.1 adenine deaminase [Bacillus halotolerans]